MPTLDPAGALKLAVQWQRSGRLSEAAAIYKQLLARMPEMPAPLHNLGMIEFSQGRLSEAITLIERAVKALPDKAEYHNALGTVLREMEKHADSVNAFREAVRLKPDYAEALANLGAAIGTYRDFKQSIEFQLKALQLEPKLAAAHNNLGVAYAKLGQDEQSEAAYRKATEVDPTYPDAHFNFSTLLHSQGRFAEARACLEESLRLRPNYTLAHVDLAMLLLRDGDYPRGWREYEWRKRCWKTLAREFPKPQWDGTPLNGQTILLYEEQGYGDAIQFVRFVPMVAQRGLNVVLEARPELHQLFAGIPGVGRIITRRDPVTFHVHQSLLSLPYCLGTTLQTIPATTPYLRAAPERVERWKAALDGLPSGLKVGLVWAGNAQHLNNHNRSVRLKQFAPLADVPGVTLVNLQKGEESAQIKEDAGGLIVHDLPGALDSFDDSAALITTLDLVIAVDTAVCHLAGALGRPVWTLIPHIPDFRWLRNRDDTPWYPTMRLFRQSTAHNWAEVISRLRIALTAFAANGVQ